LYVEGFIVGQFLESLIPWGTAAIQAVQTIHSPVLDALFVAISFLGNVEGYLLLLPLIYWCLDARLGRRLAIVVFFSLTTNFLAKIVYSLPRPDPAQVRAVLEETSPSFPSGHAQGTLVLGGYLIQAWHSRLFRLVALVMIVLVGFSRVYVGVHFPQDIVGGWVIGLIILGLYLWLEPDVTALLRGWPLWGQLIPAIIIPLGLFALKPVNEFVPSAAGMLGFSLGLVIEQHFLKFKTDGAWPQRALRYLGIVLVVALWAGSRLVFPPGVLFRFIRYALTAFTAAYVVPLILVRLGWAAQE
jgi:membrane-associated phospholipid phosphatase